MKTLLVLAIAAASAGSAGRAARLNPTAVNNGCCDAPVKNLLSARTRTAVFEVF